MSCIAFVSTTTLYFSTRWLGDEKVNTGEMKYAAATADTMAAVHCGGGGLIPMVDLCGDSEESVVYSREQHNEYGDRQQKRGGLEVVVPTVLAAAT